MKNIYERKNYEMYSKLYHYCVVLIKSFLGIIVNKQKNAASKIIDLTHTFTKSMLVHPYDDSPSIKKIRNLNTHSYNDSQLMSGMHVGTHIDGPGHLTDSELLMSDMDIDQFVGEGYLIDVRNQKLDVSLLKNMPAKEELVVLILTGFDKKFGTKEYYQDYPVISTEFAQALVKFNIKMLGIDTFSPDAYPFPVHQILFKNNVLIIENLTNLECLLGVETFKIVALPIKTETDSALARVIAMVN